MSRETPRPRPRATRPQTLPRLPSSALPPRPSPICSSRPQASSSHPPPPSAPPGSARPLPHPTPLRVGDPRPSGPAGPRPLAEPARCSRGPPSSPSTAGADAGRSLRPSSRPGLSSPHPSGQAPLRRPPHPGARRAPHSPGRRPRPSSRARVSPPRLLQPPPAPPARDPAPAGRPGLLLLRFAVTLNSLSSIGLLACHSGEGGPNCRGKRRLSPPHWRRPLKETGFLPSHPHHPPCGLWGQKERDFAADPRGGLFSLKLFFWHSPGVKEKASVPCDNSEILRAELSSGGTQPHAPRACNAHSTVGITEWEVTVVSEAVSSRGYSPPRWS